MQKTDKFVMMAVENEVEDFKNVLNKYGIEPTNCYKLHDIMKLLTLGCVPDYDVYSIEFISTQEIFDKLINDEHFGVIESPLKNYLKDSN